jgi:hypothetical protein
MNMSYTKQQVEDIIYKVNKWAKETIPDSRNYASRRTYFLSALNAGIIVEQEYKAAEKHYGILWHRGGGD